MPAQEDGQPIAVRATALVKFRLNGHYFDSGVERRRTQFNVALAKLSQSDTSVAETEAAVTQMRALAQQDFAEAIYLTARWEITGKYPAIFPKDEANGCLRMEKAAKEYFGPALYETAMRSVNKSSSEANDQKTWDQIRRAAMLGSAAAQFFLGDRHQRGVGTSRDEGRAKNYFRLCAVRGLPVCQYRLARMMYDAPQRQD